jgi:uridine phosphorylase
MPFLGATLFATVCAWLVDAVIASFASTAVRVMVGFVVSTVSFYWGLQYLRELRGR